MRNLSIAQRSVLAIGLLLIIVSFLFPCWKHSMGRSDITLYKDYQFVLAPPLAKEHYQQTSIDLSRLIVQLAVIMIVTIGAMVLLPPTKHIDGA